jgi:membrane protein
VHGQIGKGGDNLMPTLLDADVVEKHGKAISTARGRIFKDRYASRVEPFADVAVLFLRAQQDGWTIVIATSGESEEVEPHLERLGVRGLVDAVTTAGDAERSKPDPDIFAAALQKVGADAADAIVVGDSPYDIAAAAKLGMRPIAVRSGGFDDRTRNEAGAVAIYDSPADLLTHYDTSPLAAA